MNLERSLVTGVNGQRVPGVYAHLLFPELEKFIALLLEKMCAWGIEAMANGLTCGHLVKVAGGTGSGTGALFMQAQKIGPFCGQ